MYQLAAFARAGLKEPEIVRLDADIKISPELQIQFMNVRHEEKQAGLLFLLRSVLTNNESAIVFAATRSVYLT